MKRVRKVALWVLGVVLGLAVAGWIGLQIYMNTPAARRLASEQVSKLVGLPVEVTEVNVGFGSTTVSFVIPDSGSDPADPVDLLKVGRLETDITLTGIATGSVAPSYAVLRDAELTLRLDANRKIASPLPKFESGGGGKLPAVKLVNARFRIRQAGKPDFDIGGANGELAADTSSAGGYLITGTIADKTWGEWRVDGRLGADPTIGEVTLTTDSAQVSDQLLQSIPFVKPKVWKHLSATGATSARVTLGFNEDDVKYAVDVAPKGATITLPDADATLTGVSAYVRIADGKVIAKDGTLTLAGGSGKVANAVFDFDRDEYVLTIETTASGVDIRQLPASWGLPKQVEGKLKGYAKLEIRIKDDGTIDTRGDGIAEVEKAKLAGFDAEIKFVLRGENGRYRFDSEQQE